MCRWTVNLQVCAPPPCTHLSGAGDRDVGVGGSTVAGLSHIPVHEYSLPVCSFAFGFTPVCII